MAALEALHYGIPAFTMAPSCVDSVVSKDPSKIEEAVYPDESKFLNLPPLSSHCQYSLEEMNTGVLE